MLAYHANENEHLWRVVIIADSQSALAAIKSHFVSVTLLWRVGVGQLRP